MTLTQQMKKNAVIVVVKAEHWDLEKCLRLQRYTDFFFLSNPKKAGRR